MKRIVSAPTRDLAPKPQWDAYERFAREALEKLTAGDCSDCPVLQAQLAASTFEQIDYTGHGFYLTITIPESVPRLARSGKIVDVWAINISAGDNDATKYVGLILYVDTGAIACLEAHGNPDWPSDVGKFEFKYSITNCGPVEFSNVRSAAAMWGA